jgi:protein-ribulosamine 3-kinase
MEPAIDKRISEELSKYLHSSPGKIQYSSVGGGSINQAFRLSTGTHTFFLKINSTRLFPGLFLKEASGLEKLSSSGSIKTPDVIACFEEGEKQCLLLKWVEEGERTAGFWKKFGEALAALHQVRSNQFGWEEDNYMGSVRQLNGRESSWTDFFREKRLKPLVAVCDKKLDDQQKKAFEKLYLKLDQFFEKESQPSLLHGDLWSGNFLCDQKNDPVLIDPAVYFGHSSVDLGMTTLFGGFSREFYESYHYHSPFAPNYREQWKIVNLYPLLIHVHLFGSSYLSGIDQTLSEFK